jgi:hypothetical protein
MGPLRILLATIFIVVLGYTLVVGARHGWDLLPIFFANIGAMTWNGQFNVDFTGFLVLSATWVAWRHHFSGAGLALAIVAFFGGMLFLSAYLFVVATREHGSAAALLLGQRRAKQI